MDISINPEASNVAEQTPYARLPQSPADSQNATAGSQEKKNWQTLQKLCQNDNSAAA